MYPLASGVSTDRVRASGKTRAFGEDRSSGERVQQIDFSSFSAAGKGYRIRVGKDESAPFAIDPNVYRRLKYDALSFFYLQRSGIEIKMPYASSSAPRRAGPGPSGTGMVLAPPVWALCAWAQAGFARRAGTTTRRVRPGPGDRR